MDSNKTSYSVNSYKYRLKGAAKSIWQGMFVGIIASTVSLLYRFLLSEADTLRISIYSYLKVHGSWTTILWFVMLTVIGVLLGAIVKREPEVRGSGIIQVKSMLFEEARLNWLKIIMAKIIGGALAVFGGLSLGRGGPSLQLGALAGQGLGRMLERHSDDEGSLVVCGAGAGLAATFNVYLAAVIFVIEKIHKCYSFMTLTMLLTASFSSFFVSGYLFGKESLFCFLNAPPLPYNNYPYTIMLGVILGILGVFFNCLLHRTHAVYNKMKTLSGMLRFILPMYLAGILGFLLPETLGGGSNLVAIAGQSRLAFAALLSLIAVKFLFTIISCSSDAPGGLFLPLLSIGALAGCIYGYMAVDLLHMDAKYINSFIILGMAGYFTAVFKAPITGIVLVMEMVGSIDYLLTLTLVSVTSYFVARLLDVELIYTYSFRRILSFSIFRTGSSRNKKAGSEQTSSGVR